MARSSRSSNCRTTSTVSGQRRRSRPARSPMPLRSRQRVVDRHHPRRAVSHRRRRRRTGADNIAPFGASPGDIHEPVRPIRRAASLQAARSTLRSATSSSSTMRRVGAVAAARIYRQSRQRLQCARRRRLGQRARATISFTRDRAGQSHRRHRGARESRPMTLRLWWQYSTGPFDDPPMAARTPAPSHRFKLPLRMSRNTGTLTSGKNTLVVGFVAQGDGAAAYNATSPFTLADFATSGAGADTVSGAINYRVVTATEFADAAIHNRNRHERVDRHRSVHAEPPVDFGNQHASAQQQHRRRGGGQPEHAGLHQRRQGRDLARRDRARSGDRRDRHVPGGRHQRGDRPARTGHDRRCRSADALSRLARRRLRLPQHHARPGRPRAGLAHAQQQSAADVDPRHRIRPIREPARHFGPALPSGGLVRARRVPSRAGHRRARRRACRTDDTQCAPAHPFHADR